MIQELLELNHKPLSLNVNKLTIPVEVIDLEAPAEVGAEKFNKIYRWVKAQGWHKIITTPSGGISKSRKNLKVPSWRLFRTGASVEMWILCKEGMWRICAKNATSQGEQQKISPHIAFMTFRTKLLENKINLNKYAITNGKEIKQQIPKQLVSLARPSFQKLTFEHVYHVDFHSSHMAGLANTHPEFRETVEWFYNRRKEKPEYKAVLTNTWGWFQSIKCCDAQWAHLAKDALEDTNKRVLELAERVIKAGGTVLVYNTDGFWYTRKEGAYHGEGEGKALGQWENDHFDCKFRAKSDGAYEYIENEVYTPVIRGKTKLDKLQPDRSKWTWGSIFERQVDIPVGWLWDDEIGFYRNMED